MNVIGIGGYARCGKDTFVSIAKQILAKNNYYPLRMAFADQLKNEVQKMLNDNDFKLDVYTTETEAKNKIRPLLVWWGCSRRDLNESGLYWVNRVDKELRALKDTTDTSKHVILVSDVRFANEATWIHNDWDGEIIHIRRFTTINSESPVIDSSTGNPSNTNPIRVFNDAPNQEEAKNDPFVRAVANVNVEWKSREIPAGGVVTDDSYLQSEVLKALNSTKVFNGKLTL